MTATGSRSAVPTGAWGRPARLQAPEQPDRADPLVDLRDAPIDRPRSFTPTPPPPAPPGARPRRVATRRRLTGGRRIGLEALVALLLLAGLAAFARPPAPAPLTPQARWETATADRVVALTRDLASAADAPAWSPVIAARLKADLARAQSSGPPPDPVEAPVWNRAVQRVEAALAQAAEQPAAARSELRTAGLELTALSGGGSGGGSRG